MDESNEEHGGSAEIEPEWMGDIAKPLPVQCLPAAVFVRETAAASNNRRETKRVVRGAVVVYTDDTPAIEILEPHEVAQRGSQSSFES